MRPDNVHVFIGYDDREPLEWKVAKESLLKNASGPVCVYPVKHTALREIGLFWREYLVTSRGTYEDLIDKRPFSTQFAFTRFLVPHLATYLGVPKEDPCIFVDSDFVFLKDIYKLFDGIDYQSKPLWVVKHNYQPANVIKMDNQIQTNYSKKNWSSFMLFNRLFNDALPHRQDVNIQSGSWLHSFSWLPNAEEEIGSLPEGWNFIPNHSEERVKHEDIMAIHYTEGTPVMNPNCKYSYYFYTHVEKILQEEIVNARSYLL